MKLEEIFVSAFCVGIQISNVEGEIKKNCKTATINKRNIPDRYFCK